MLSHSTPVLRDLVLIGGGHSHVGVLKDFAMKPMAGLRLTLICSDSHTPYSGMLPGYVAGHYDYDEVHIDLRRLAEFAGARFYLDEAIGLDRTERSVSCRGRPPVAYDLLSINIGSTPQLARVAGAAEQAVAVKPIFQFNRRWLDLLQRVREQAGPVTIAVVGAGAGGVELTLAMQYRLQEELQRAGGDAAGLQFHLFSDEPEILPSHNRNVQRRFEQVLSERGVILHRSAAVTRVEASRLECADGSTVQADEIFWATHAGGAAWLAQTGLALDADGFLSVNAHLQSTGDPKVFAAGDIASMVGQPLEKAGVFAVRQAGPLARNLRRALRGQSLRPYRPQRNWLALISTGDRHAIASRGQFACSGDWVWRWKDWIDRRFMRRFSDLQMPATAPGVSGTELSLNADEAEQAVSAAQMRCGGCGAKVGASILSKTLGQLRPITRDDVLIGLDSPDDAAVLRIPEGMALVHSVDFFRAFITDPYLFGRIAANHALGDIFAMGAQAQSATALVTLPPGLEAKLGDDLSQMMRGAVEVLNEAGCALVGGHTGEGAEMALGFAINGLIDAKLETLTRKNGMREQELLILCKPLGTGVLLAAQARLRAKGRWIDAALSSMLQSSSQAAQCLQQHGASACTDVTGFGLLGHLQEMVRASGGAAEIFLDRLPALEGAVEMLDEGLRSSLHEANRKAWVQEASLNIESGAFQLLFDPQTAGGLLASMAPERAAGCVNALRARGYERAAVIGQVLPTGSLPGTVRVKL